MLILRQVRVEGRSVDVAVVAGRIARIAPDLVVPTGANVIDGRGGELLPGLHDHHLHLLAMAAARESVAVGPPAVRSPGQLADALARAARLAGPGEWIRAVGYHDSVAGPLTRHDLDRFAPDRPVRVQHRSGALWILNSRGLELLGLSGPGALPAGEGARIECEPDGTPTGRFYGLDSWLRAQLGGTPPALGPVGSELAAYGITGVTDATPTEEAGDVELLAGAVRRGELPQTVRVTGGLALDPRAAADLGRGPVKLMLSDHGLPALDALVDAMVAAHDRGRPVALHCVTRAALFLALAAWDEARPMPGDRLEHGAVVPAGQARRLAEMGVTVVTQPGFVVDRGDAYLDEVEADDRPHLWPCRSLFDAGVPVGGSSDAPFGDADPWRAMDAAVHRRTTEGRTLGEGERISPEAALRLYLAPLESPGGAPRAVTVGAPADLVLLRAPWEEVRHGLSAEAVALTTGQGNVTYERLD